VKEEMEMAKKMREAKSTGDSKVGDVKCSMNW
jgi:hypothetical protein